MPNCTPMMLPAVEENCFHQLSRKLVWMMMWTGTLRRNGVADMVEFHIVHPSNNGALIESCVTSNLSCTPTFVDDQSRRFKTQAWKMWISGVGHVHTVSRGDAKVLNHYIQMTKMKKVR